MNSNTCHIIQHRYVTAIQHQISWSVQGEPGSGPQWLHIANMVHFLPSGLSFFPTNFTSIQSFQTTPYFPPFRITTTASSVPILWRGILRRSWTIFGGEGNSESEKKTLLEKKFNAGGMNTCSDSKALCFQPPNTLRKLLMLRKLSALAFCILKARSG